MKSDHIVIEIERTEINSDFRKDLKKFVLLDEMGSFVFLRERNSNLIGLYQMGASTLGSLKNGWDWDYLGDSCNILTLCSE